VKRRRYGDTSGRIFEAHAFCAFDRPHVGVEPASRFVEEMVDVNGLITSAGLRARCRAAICARQPSVEDLRGARRL
jgi:hypothetical protein